AGLVDYGLESLGVLAPTLGAELGFARAHPVPVPPQRVDLAVMGQHPEWLGEVPVRERIRAVALVEDDDGRLEVFIVEVWVELAHLRRDEQTLVDDGPARHR